jgi:thiol-disulfide isomerase/thioredoxin
MFIIERLAYTLICMSCALGSAAQSGSKGTTGSGYVLTGNISGLKTGKVYLSCSDGPADILDSGYAKDGKFRFTGKIKEPLLYILKIEGMKNAQRVFFLEAGQITISGDKDSLGKAVVSGGPVNDQWSGWVKEWRTITRGAGPMYRRLDSATRAGNGTPSPEERKAFDEGMALLEGETNAAVLAFIHKYPQSPVGPFIIIDRYINYPNEEMMEKAFTSLGEQARNSIYGLKVQQYKMTASKTAIGASPDFTLADTSESMFTLSSLRGKYVLVDFWASWCVPCRRENPNVLKAYKAYHDKGLDIVSVSLDNNKGAWMKAIEKDSLTWRHVSDLKGWKGDLVREYGIKVVPTNFLIDRSGKVIAKNLRGEKLDQALHSLFTEAR